jgi:hypothetical protein
MALNTVSSERLSTNVKTSNLGTELSKKVGQSKNLIINGAFLIAERGTSSTTSGLATVDRFQQIHNGTDEAPTQAQVDVASGTTPYTNGFRKAFKITNGNQSGGAGVNDYIWIQTKLESQHIANSGWNYVSSSSYITLSFWVKSSVEQDFKGYLRSRDGTQLMYPFNTGTLTADTWTKITKSIPGNSSLQFDNDVNEGLQLNIGCFFGDNLTSAATAENAWATWNSSARAKVFTPTWYTTDNATFEITGVQLELGSVATDFEHRTVAEEALLCKRYYISSTDFHHICVNNGESDRWIRFMVEMRDAPTVTTSPTNSVSFSPQNQTKHGFAGNGSGSSLANFNMPWTADAEL